MRMGRIWTLMALAPLALVGDANGDEEESVEITVDPNQVVVQVFGIV